ncbi:lipopolysaccharide-induced tumor necrosis factor-alpha factor homolog [Drosophila sulfurigaster albostrigata]|uniref:lipopolysaccharide-induced tumor necrosis factor-alpha factor homolog n=1 Tax=Drosophila sulfurigaster albostrigata TaxID=89887 RepID=UPI002D21E142|nr:lipopolysaccharide-induced tumor necrosis factor-alpha factor homolog [Drosophila sulfurigaster albostrigata]
MSQGYTPTQTYQAGASQLLIQTTTTTNVVTVGRESCRVQCPSCHEYIQTKVKRKPTGRTHFWALILCLFFCWPCVYVPYCTKSCHSAEHSCPKCGAHIGRYEK